MYVDPKYGIVGPDSGTSLDDLGSEFVQMIQSFSAALESFDYNGADPNTVLARVAALEASVSSLTGAVEALKIPFVQRGNHTLALPASKAPAEIVISYAETFADIPALTIIPMSGLSIMDGLTWRIKARGTTGFTIEAYAATARNFAFDYAAVGV